MISSQARIIRQKKIKSLRSAIQQLTLAIIVLFGLHDINTAHASATEGFYRGIAEIKTCTFIIGYTGNYVEGCNALSGHWNKNNWAYIAFRIGSESLSLRLDQQYGCLGFDNAPTSTDSGTEFSWSWENQGIAPNLKFTITESTDTELKGTFIIKFTWEDSGGLKNHTATGEWRAQKQIHSFPKCLRPKLPILPDSYFFCSSLTDQGCDYRPVWELGRDNEWRDDGAQPKNVKLLNPFVDYLSGNAGSIVVDPAKLLAGPTSPAKGLSSDGASAVAVAITSIDKINKVTLQLDTKGALGNNMPGLSYFDPNFLSDSHVRPPLSKEIELRYPDHYFCDKNNKNCAYLALLWSAESLPASSNKSAISLPLVVTAKQADAPVSAYINLEPPPVLMVHGVWSSAREAGFDTAKSGGLGAWLNALYGNQNRIKAVDYGHINYKAFSDPEIQAVFAQKLKEHLLSVNASYGMAARQVDVVGHSMGGLVARQFMTGDLIFINNRLPEKVIHKLVTIGTPHYGSGLATILDTYKDKAPLGGAISINPYAHLLDALCTADSIAPCTLGALLGKSQKQVGAAVKSLRPDSYDLLNLSDTDEYDAIVGQSPLSSGTENQLNLLIKAYLPSSSVETVLGPQNDTIVSVQSQRGNDTYAAPIYDIVHTALGAGDIGETSSQSVWRKVYNYLTGRFLPEESSSLPQNTSLSPPSLDLSGCTEISSDAVEFFGYTVEDFESLFLGRPAYLEAWSATKTIKEFWIFDTSNATGNWLLYPTDPANPLRIDFTPRKIGAMNFAAFVLFDDKTFAIKTLKYKTAWEMGPSIILSGVPEEAVPAGSTFRIATIVPIEEVDVSNGAVYTVRSGTQSVIKVNPDRSVTTIADGSDWLDVTYEGSKASAEIVVGAPEPFTAYTLTVAKAGNGSGTVGGGGTYAYNTTVTPTATPDTGSTLTGWSPASCGSPFPLTADTTCTATFTLDTHTLTVTKTGRSGAVTSSDGGISCGVNCAKDYPHGTSVTLTATPAAGLTGWGGACAGAAGNTCTLTMDGDKGVEADFKLTAPGKPTTLAPRGGTTIATNQPTYSWNADSTVAYYGLFVLDRTGAKVWAWYTPTQTNCASGTGTCSITPPVPLASGNAAWYLVGWNTVGLSPWSDATPFVVDGQAPPAKPTTLAPTGTLTTNLPTYSWNAVKYAAYYMLYVIDPAGTKVATWYTAAEAGCASGTGTCTITPSMTVTGNGAWYVVGWNELGLGPWSDATTFTAPGLAAPAKLTLIAPRGPIATNQPTYAWNAVSNAGYYGLYVLDRTGAKVWSWYTSAQANCASGSGTCSITPPVPLASGNATWYVVGWNTAGLSPWSDAGAFTVPN